MLHSPFRPAVLTVVLAASVIGSAAVLAQAQGAMPGHGDPQRGTGAAAPSGGVSAGQGDMMAAMERMDRDMMVPSTRTGDPDRDLVAMMIPHHQGAIDMARIYLRTGRDPQIRHMAEKIVADQEREISEMRAWQARHPAPVR